MELREGFFEEEILDGYRVSRETKQVWAVNLRLLEVLQMVCEHHKLHWFIAYGTLLGAFRHQGFIPWDDDVDVIMPREDFDRLQQLAKEFITPYFLQTPETDPGFWHGGIIRLCDSSTACIAREELLTTVNQGVALEIFPLDACADGWAGRRSQDARVSRMQALRWALQYDRYPWEWRWQSDGWGRPSPQEWAELRWEAEKIGRTAIETRLQAATMAYMGKQTERCAIYTSGNRQNRYPHYYTEDFSKAVMMPFENLQLPAPVGFWRVLTKRYGQNFLQRFYEENRHPHHEAFWSVEESYADYRAHFNDIFTNTEGKIIVLFGTGHMLLSYEARTKGKFVPAFYVDNDSRKWGGERQGIPIRSPEALLSVPKVKLHVIICNNYFREIGRQLRGMGILEYYVYIESPRVVFTTVEELGRYANGQLNIRGNRHKKHVPIGYIELESINRASCHAVSQAREYCDYLMVGVLNADAEKLSLAEALKGADCVVPAEEGLAGRKIAKQRYAFDCLFLMDSADEDTAVIKKLSSEGIMAQII